VDRVLDKVTELFALRIGDGRAQILNLDQSFADKHDLSNIGNASHP
jgi:hypothetical protein